MQQPTKNSSFFHPTKPQFIIYKPQKFSSFIVSNSKGESFSPSNSSDETEQQPLADSKQDRVKLALERAKKYKKSLQLDKNQESSKDPIDENAGIVSEIGVEDKEAKEDVRIAMEKAKEDLQSKGIEGNGNFNVESENFSDGDGGKEMVREAVRLAMEKAEEYEKNTGMVGDNKSREEIEQLHGEVTGDDMEVSENVNIAMGKAKEYKKNKGSIDSSSSIVEDSESTELEAGSPSNLGNASIEQDTEKKGDFKLSSIDFAGLSFSDKKTGRGLPPGLVGVPDPFSYDELPEVEILVGDASKFGNAVTSESKTPSQEESSDLYKPKVSTWGMFPRPSNISETFGGGRNIRPGESLETPEDRAAKDARTQQLIAVYKRKMGLNMDPKLKAESEKALKDGDSLMDVGRLKEALPYYQTVMDKLPFQTELHGLAALNWSICQDSLTRPEEARVMYEKLQTHPNGEVSKKARQFMFSFQAMEMLKVTKSNAPRKNTGYHSYFEAFVEDKAINTSESTQEKEDALRQAVLYIVFLVSPILLLLLFVAIKRV